MMNRSKKNQPGLFSDSNQNRGLESGSFEGAPLADRVRPLSLENYVGQDFLVGPGTPLRRAIEEDRLLSFLLWGPPGSGKTTLARIVAQQTKSEFLSLSAVMAGVKDIKEAMDQAKQRREQQGLKTILFVDEIHRFNKSQQDALLPFVENGTVTLIGATTENPSFEVNSALLSRMAVYVLRPLAQEYLERILKRSLNEISFKKPFPALWFQHIAAEANGDARRALGLLERVVNFLNSSPSLALESSESWTDEMLLQALGQKSFRYDSTGEEHYNTVSAFIKSMRDNDPDAALYYLARMLEGGEDPLFIARRMVIFASEDVGNADPRALNLAVAVRDAVDFVGMPEARISLAQGVTFLASAPKSRASYEAVEKAFEDVRQHGNLEIPLHIRNAPTKLMKDLGYGSDRPRGEARGGGNLPKKLESRRYYEPQDVGVEKQIRERLAWVRSQGRP